MAEPSPRMRRRSLLDQLRIQHVTDVDLDRILRIAANDAKRMIMSLQGNEKIGASVRRAQQELARAHIQMWREGIKGVMVDGIGMSFDQTAKRMAIFDEVLLRSVDGNLAYWRQSMLETARVGMDSFLSRKVNGITLSERVYRDGLAQSAKLRDMIDSSLLRGLSVREIASQAFAFIDPLTPGGTSYAAKRLARSEINNAYHQSSIRRAQDSPWVTHMRWNLSSSHPKPDECDQFAHDEHTRGGGSGVFRKGDVPGKPHPQCFCYVTPITVDDDEFVLNWKRGRYDSFIEEITGDIARMKKT